MGNRTSQSWEAWLRKGTEDFLQANTLSTCYSRGIAIVLSSESCRSQCPFLPQTPTQIRFPRRDEKNPVLLSLKLILYYQQTGVSIFAKQCPGVQYTLGKKSRPRCLLDLQRLLPPRQSEIIHSFIQYLLRKSKIACWYLPLLLSLPPFYMSTMYIAKFALMWSLKCSYIFLTERSHCLVYPLMRKQHQIGKWMQLCPISNSHVKKQTILIVSSILMTDKYPECRGEFFGQSKTMPVPNCAYSHLWLSPVLWLLHSFPHLRS